MNASLNKRISVSEAESSPVMAPYLVKYIA